MIIATAQPPVPDFRAAFSHYWNKAIFAGPPSDDHATRAYVTTYMRLVESCLSEYRAADLKLQDFWVESSSFKLSLAHTAISHFETCITNAQRAIRCFNKFRASQYLHATVQIELKGHAHTFHTDKVAKRLRDIRDTIHHFDRAIEKREVAYGEPFTLQPTGPDVPVEGEPGQTIKTIDRLQIGPHELLLADLAKWLTEMGECAEIISRFHVDQLSPAAAFVQVT
jgi:hypothetical protein